MKVVYASTPEQEDKIGRLVDHFFSNILPKYFHDEEIEQFIEMNFLNISGSQTLSGTMKESYQIITSLEIICFLIESDCLHKSVYQQMFDRNAHILNDLGFTFPFSYQQFLEKNDLSLDMGSIFIKPANHWIV